MDINLLAKSYSEPYSRDFFLTDPDNKLDCLETKSSLNEWLRLLFWATMPIRRRRRDGGGFWWNRGMAGHNRPPLTPPITGC